MVWFSNKFLYSVLINLNYEKALSIGIDENDIDY